MNESVAAILLEKAAACPCGGHVHGRPLVSSHAPGVQSVEQVGRDIGPEGEHKMGHPPEYTKRG
jgi:hypothetical protein